MPLGKAFAAMQVNGVSGTVADGASITIQGSGFGNTGPNVVIFDNFENGTVGSTIKTGTGSATIGKWDSLGSPNPHYTNTASLSGTKAFQGHLNQSIGWSPHARALMPAGTRKFFTSVWLEVPAGSPLPGENTGQGINWKVLWAATTAAEVNDHVMPLIGNYNSTQAMSSNDLSDVWLNPAIPFQKGVWVRVWAYVDGKTDSTGTKQLWWLAPSVGVKQAVNQVGNVQTMSTNQDFTMIDVNAYGRQETVNGYQNLDDFYLAVGDGARARVEIGNNSNYNSCTKLTIATVTSWSDTSVKATVRQGPFNAGENAYLFVVDANGNVSPGRAVTIGGTASGGSSLPAPSLVSVTIQ